MMTMNLGKFFVAFVASMVVAVNASKMCRYDQQGGESIVVSIGTQEAGSDKV